MITLKIKDKGIFLQIPGMPSVRCPAEIDITKYDLSVIMTSLRKSGVKDFQIVSSSKQKEKTVVTKSIKNRSNPKPSNNLDDRFSRLEQMINQLLEKDGSNITQKEEQTINKTILEDLKIENKEIKVRPKKKPVIKRKDEPEVEELDDFFIPSVDISNLKLKGGVDKTIKQDVDIDNNVDLLSRIMAQEE